MKAACEECETGECPCGTGCPTCFGTLSCEVCHGAGYVEVVPITLRVRKHRGGGTIVCDVCNRQKPVVDPPTPEQYAGWSVRQRARALTAVRCVGCHASFNGSHLRPNTYRLQEAS